LDHLYTKTIIDLSAGPAVVELPEVEEDRYFSIQIADQEHHTIYDEIHPVGTYAFVRKGKDMERPEGATVIECPGDYPHLFVRVQVKNAADMPNKGGTSLSKGYQAIERFSEDVDVTYDIRAIIPDLAPAGGEGRRVRLTS
jgi:hypothetical protein